MFYLCRYLIFDLFSLQYLTDTDNLKKDGYITAFLIYWFSYMPSLLWTVHYFVCFLKFKQHSYWFFYMPFLLWSVHYFVRFL